MGLFDRLKRRFAGRETAASEPEEALEAAEEAPEPTQEAPEVSSEEEALIGRVTRLRVTGQETLEQSFLTMRIYTFTAPFDRKDMTDLMEALRFLGFRLYALGIEVSGRDGELPCEGLTGFLRAVHETEADIDGCTASGSYAGGRFSCHIARAGRMQFSYDTLRPISLEAFEELFAPEEEP